jgi:XTP/dITP diphosphohydrolase
MKIVLASGNKGKIKEIESLLPGHEVIPYSSLLGEFDVVEDADTFKGNAIKKAKEIYNAIGDDEIVVISDDSGLSVPALQNEPNIYSARYAGENASDKENNQKLIDRLTENNLSRTPAYYTAAIAMIYKNNIYTSHGWMHGDVINHSIGDGGFGYDPLFIPCGYEETLGTLDISIKKELSHRTKALQLMEKYMEILL